MSGTVLPPFRNDSNIPRNFLFRNDCNIGNTQSLLKKLLQINCSRDGIMSPMQTLSILCCIRPILEGFPAAARRIYPYGAT